MLLMNRLALLRYAALASIVLVALVSIGAIKSTRNDADPRDFENTQRLSDDNSAKITLYSKTIGTLAPHTHSSLDSILDGGHGEVVQLENEGFVINEDTWVTGFRWEIENAPIETLHHFILTRQDKPALLCPNGFSDKEEILTVGSDTLANEFHFPPSYGIFLPKGTPLGLEAIMHNPLPPFGPGGTYKEVRVKVTLFIGEKEQTYTPVQRVRLSLEDPACTPRSSTFDVPAQSTSFVKKMDSPISKYTFKTAATILLMGAHTHAWEGGERVSVYLNEELLHEFVPKRKNSDPWSWATPATFSSIRVRAGDTIRITATYSNAHDQPLLNDAMGMIMIAFAPDQ